MSTCPNCSGPVEWFGRRRGSSYYRCTICAARFKRTPSCPDLLPVRAHAVRRPDRPLSDEEITLIITSFDVTHRAMEQQLGIGRELIRRIRIGASYADRCPELERWRAFNHRPSCCRCVNWRPHPEFPCCAFGFPDPVQESTYFARECLHYQPT